MCFASLPAASHLHTGQLFLIVVGNLKVSLIGWLASEASEGVVIVFAVNVAGQQNHPIGLTFFEMVSRFRSIFFSPLMNSSSFCASRQIWNHFKSLSLKLDDE